MKKKTTLESLITPKILIPSSITSSGTGSSCGSPQVFEAWLQVHLAWDFQARAGKPVAQK